MAALDGYEAWLVPICFFGWSIGVCGAIMAWVFRKPGVDLNVLINGFEDEPPLRVFHLKRTLGLVRDDKVGLVYWTLFSGVFLMVAGIFTILFVGSSA